MRTTQRAWVWVAGLILAAGFGCTDEEEGPESQALLVEDLFQPLAMRLLGSGNAYDVRYELRDGVEQDMAAEEIAAYLRGEQGARTTELDIGRGLIGYHIHPRDFWALVLADLKGVEFPISADRKDAHEEDIKVLLSRIERRADE